MSGIPARGNQRDGVADVVLKKGSPCERCPRTTSAALVVVDVEGQRVTVPAEFDGASLPMSVCRRMSAVRVPNVMTTGSPAATGAGQASCGGPPQTSSSDETPSRRMESLQL
jgi:hypothetical protein